MVGLVLGSLAWVGGRPTSAVARTQTPRNRVTRRATVRRRKRSGVKVVAHRRLGGSGRLTRRQLPGTLQLAGDGSFTKPHVHFETTPAYRQSRGIQQQPDTLLPSRHYRDNYAFKTALYLPQQLAGRQLNDPQSAAFGHDGHYLYVMYVDKQEATNRNQQGWAVRYDWTKLMQLGAGRPGQMGMLRLAAKHQASGRLTPQDRRVLACIKVGPVFDSGHAQSLAENPQNGQLWYVKAYDTARPNQIVHLNPRTLRPETVVNYQGPFDLGAVLTFDNRGQAYFWTHAKVATPATPLGTVRLYRGTVGNQGIHFQAIQQWLASDPGFYAQSMGYDPASDRLFLVADESITSLPAAKLGHLKKTDVGEINFNGQREFEGLFFMPGTGQGFLLTNRGAEIMRMIK
ncbi:hypothetical protein [Lactiplantibacillus plajomi]